MKPEACDFCGFTIIDLKKFKDRFGSGSSWLCKYCQHDYFHGQSDVTKTIACMLNELEKCLKGNK